MCQENYERIASVEEFDVTKTVQCRVKDEHSRFNILGVESIRSEISSEAVVAEVKQ